MMFRKFPFCRQFDQMDCGPACIRMVAMSYGRNYPLSYMRTISCLSRKGVSVAGIRSALSEIGMDSASYELTLEQLREQCPLPAILYWEQNHFVVLYDIKRSRVGRQWRYYVANPAYGKTALSEDDFSRGWVNGEKGVAIAMEPEEEFYSKPEVKEKHSFFRFARKYVFPFRREIAILSSGLLFGLAISLVTPFLTQALVDKGIMMRNMGIITALLAAQILIFIGSFSMQIVSSWVALYMGTRININILRDYLSKLLRLPMTFFETKSVGDYQQRIGDHSRLQGFATQATIQTLFSFVFGAILLVIIGYFSCKILVAYLILTALATLWMNYFWQRRKTLDYETFRVRTRNQNKLYEMMTGISDIKLNSYSDFKLREWNDIQEEQYRMNQKSLRLGQIQNTGYALISQLRNILITFWIAAEVVDGNLTMGMMMSISNIIGQVNGPLSQLINFLQQFQDAKISLERSEEVYLASDEDAEGLASMPGDHPEDLEVRNLTFRYTGETGRPALDDVSLTIPAGRMTAIVGESGSGKTTLMKLLLKFYKPSEGTITIGERDIAEYKAESIRRNTGIVMQDNFVFSDTIKNNIILGEPYDRERLDRVIRIARLDDYIGELPLGVETKIGVDATGISGGERQRIMIARAIYKNPSYLMLDEATSSLDAENEAIITSNIAEEFKHRTMLVIAHRLSTVKNADNIIVLKHGKVVESGTHQELVSNKGYYFELVRNQLELSE